ncbi:MAG: ATP-binding cassette domain-containing protein [Adlercreutzia equolifaciens]
MAEVYTEPTPSAFGPRPTDPGTPVPLDGDGTTTLDGIAAAFSRENYVAGAASAASAASGRGAHTAHGAHRAADPLRAPKPATPSTLGSPILSVRSIEKVFGSRDSVTHALAGVSFDVAAGEFVGIMGPSGSGKTTLLNCVSTIDTVIERPASSSAGATSPACRGRQLAKFRRDDLGFIFQDSNLLDTLTALREHRAGPDHQRASRRAPSPREVERHGRARSASMACCRNTLTRCPAARSSAWPRPAPWSLTRSSSWPMSLLAPWIPAPPP